MRIYLGGKKCARKELKTREKEREREKFGYGMNFELFDRLVKEVEN